MSPRLAACALAALALLPACARVRPAPAFEEGRGGRPLTLEVAGHGRIALAVPPGWEARWTMEGDPAQPSVLLAKRGARFLARLSPIRPAGEPESPQALADAATLYADLGRHRALAGSVERELPLEELSGPGVHGAYFSATDGDLVGREPGPDEFRHVLQGAAAVGPFLLAFTLLDDGPGPWRAELLDVVRTARHAPEGAPAEGAPPDEGGVSVEPMPGVDTVPLRVALPGRSWAVLVDLPRFQVARVPPGRTPGTVHVLGRSPETELIASVILSRAGEARDAVACRERALARIRGEGLEDLRRAEGGGAAAATYTIRSGAGGAPEWHAHAFRWREGVCANVHVSKAAPGPDDAARLDAVLSTVRIAEDL